MKKDSKWYELLKDEFDKPYMQKLKSLLKDEYGSQEIFPAKQHIFRALELTDFDQVVVCALGQDPYFNIGQANGLAFAVNSGIKTPPSLQNIFKEIKIEYDYTPKDTTLIGWAQQGVLLLNTVLTVRNSKPNSHRGMGWEAFTDKIINLLNNKQSPIVFLLWGSAARNKKSLITNTNHLVLEAAHPSPLSAYNGFFNCNHFKEANSFLLKNNFQQINWDKSGEIND